MAKADNQLALLWLLHCRRRMTAQQLAAALGVSVRSVYRYIDSLLAGGVPVIAQAGPNGGYSLMRGFQMAPLAVAALTPDQTKRLKPAATVRVEVWPPRGGPVHSWLEPLEQAVAEGITLQLTYQKHESQVPEVRVVDPYGLAAVRGQWYLAGFCHARQALRNFRIDRILDLKTTDQFFSRPAEFSVSEHFAAWLRAQANTPPFTTVRLCGRPSAIAKLWGHDYLRHCRVERGPREATFRLDERGLTEMPHYLLPYGTDVAVVEPDTLRTALAKLAALWTLHHLQEPQHP